MRQHIKKILVTPKLATGIALAIAVIVGVTSYIIHNKMLAERFAKITTIGTVISGADKESVSPQDLTLAFPIGGRIEKVSVKIGDTVKAGTVLASLDSLNALGALNQAEASYNKLVNGASTPDIEIAKVALNNAKNSYDNVVSQQKVLVANALSNMLNSGLVALPAIKNNINTIISPVISGTYSGTEEGSYTITVYPAGNEYYFSFSGLESGSGLVSTVAVPLGTRGLYIQFPNNFTSSVNATWTISIPNTQSPAYLACYSAYQSALQNQNQAVASAQGVVDAAQATLDQKLASARSEDLDMAKAQVEIAKGAYNNTIITAPVDGTITNVSITAGQIAMPNTPAIELLSK